MSGNAIASSALIIDDEPEYLQWVMEFLNSLSIRTEFARTLPEGLAAIDRRRHRVVLVDLEVPAPGASEQLAKAHNPVIAKYAGLAAAIHARNRGYRAQEVIVYSVHDDDAAEAELKKLGCRYLLKGRPEELKAALRRVIEGRKSPPRHA
jgi:CheY-like chemotaxis protein